ncbi:MAG: hypothetical protein LBR55_07600 [Bacteroidales bacterium]|jgi:hypothetical protein|nr:hypothetical protein [Bacteroidales bacterium]
MQFIKSLAFHYAQLLWLLLALPFVYGLLLYVLSKCTRKLFVKAGVPSVDIFVTGWIGVPLHELGHALFCVVFNHKIQEIQLFKPNKQEGTLGYVTHSYNPQNWYQAAGNFFIGCGPMIIGVLMLYFVTLLFFSGTFILHPMQLVPLHENISFVSFFTTTGHFVQQSFGSFWQFFKQQDFTSWQLWVYVYITLAISSHMQLSMSDIRIMLRGLLVLCILLLFGMLIAEVWHFSVVARLAASIVMNYLYALLLFALCVSALNFIISYICMAIVYAVRKRQFLSPF